MKGGKFCDSQRRNSSSRNPRTFFLLCLRIKSNTHTNISTEGVLIWWATASLCACVCVWSLVRWGRRRKEFHQTFGVIIATENSTMRRSWFSTRRRSISSAMSAIKSFQPPVVWPSMSCRFIKKLSPSKALLSNSSFTSLIFLCERAIGKHSNIVGCFCPCATNVCNHPQTISFFCN